ncbi:hypothetical protein IFR05_011382 [Cadophora sp. M221]|nr:hypothetical protein IFR05_011382 [Cadophora sp. M221]
MDHRRFLVIGATGKQGGAVLDNLLASISAQSHQILALTRNAETARAKLLASNPNVILVRGDLSHIEAIFEKAGPIDGVYCVSVPGKSRVEESQAKSLIDASIAHGVKHFVFASVDRGGPKLSNETPTSVPHFASKHRIEAYLKERTGSAQSSMKWTILRPVVFMENLSPDFLGKTFAAMWAGLGTTSLQLVAIKDIGHFGAAALIEPEKYQGREIGIAGDELTYEEASKIFQQTMGFAMPTVFSFLGAGIQLMVKELRTMFSWFKMDGYKVDIEALRMEYPELQDFRTWLEKSSKFEKC